MNRGVGRAPMGSSPLGFGAPSKQNSTSKKLYQNGEFVQLNAASLNAVTGDIERDPLTGIHRGMDGVAQQVYLALRTLKGSAVVQRLGINIKILTISDTIAQKVDQAVNEALSSLVTRGLIRVESIKTERIKMTAIRITVKWINMTNGESNVSRWDNG